MEIIFTKRELINAIQDYINTVGEEEGVDFIGHIKNEKSKNIIHTINEAKTTINRSEDLTMKTFEHQAAQGDFLITRIDELPSDLTAVEKENGELVIAHSETGHHHVARGDFQLLADPANPFVCYLMANDEGMIDHLRTFDTHESLLVKSGIYRINRQREYAAEGFRRAAD